MNPDHGVGPGARRRALDLAVASVTLLVLLVPMLVVALAIRLESRGPALFRQERIGQGGRRFMIFKFRTMFAGATGSTLTVPGDSRVTRLGRVLRAACIDELPQLINVLFGHMTLVGPRPQTPALADEYPPSLATLFRYRPGLTGPGVLLLNDEDVLRGGGDEFDARWYYLEEVAPARVALDLQYLEHPTLRRTFGLLFETARHTPARFALQRPFAFRRRTALPVPAGPALPAMPAVPTVPTVLAGAPGELAVELPVATAEE